VVLFGCYSSISLQRQRKATNLSHVVLISVGVKDQVKGGSEAESACEEGGAENVLTCETGRHTGKK